MAARSKRDDGSDVYEPLAYTLLSIFRKYGLFVFGGNILILN